MSMFSELMIATGMVVLTVCLHGVALMGLSRTLDRLEPASRSVPINPALAQGTVTAILVALGLLAISTAEIWIYATLYLQGGAIPDLRSAVYYSTITYAAVGYSDAEIIDSWRLVGAIEGVNGVLLLGWSVAFLVSRLTRQKRGQAEARRSV